MRQLPPNSRVGRALHGDRVAWGATEHLLAAAVDALRGANWQRGGGKGARPRPVQRPGDKTVKRMGTPRPMSEVRALLDRWKAGEFAEAS